MEIIPGSTEVTVFVCANCARSGRAPLPSQLARCEAPDFEWPPYVQQVVLPCTGRLQPEHVLKAFETGSRIVSIVGCEEENCRHIEGSRRCGRRVDYLRSLLNEIGLGDERLLFFQLPGSALEDMAAASGKSAGRRNSDAVNRRITAVLNDTISAFRRRPPSPLRDFSHGEDRHHE